MSSDANISNLSGYYPSQDISKILDGRITQIVNVKHLPVKGRSFLLCDNEYSYGIITFSSAAKKVKRGDVSLISDSIGLTPQALDSIWPKRRHYYTFNIDVSRFPRKKAISRLTHDGPISQVTSASSKKNIFIDATSVEDLDKINQYPLKIKFVEME